MSPIKNAGPSQQDLLRHQAAKRLLANGTVKSFEDLPPALQRGSVNVSKAVKGEERTKQLRQNQLTAATKIETNRQLSTTTAQVNEQSMRVSRRVNQQVKENKQILRAAAHDKNPVIRGIAKATDAATYRLAEKTNDAISVASDHYRAGMKDAFAKGNTGSAILNYTGNALVQMGDGLVGYNRVLDHRSTVEETRGGLITAGTNLVLGGGAKMLGKGLVLTESQAAKLASLNKPLFRRGAAATPTPVAKAGVGDWVRSNGSPKNWTPALTREHYLATAPKKAAGEISKLNANELRAVYPEGGPIPRSVNDMARIKGFGDLAKAHPEKARVLTESNALFGEAIKDSRRLVKEALVDARKLAGRPLTEAEKATAHANGLAKAVDEYAPQLPVSRPHATDPRYLVMERGPKSPDTIPERQLRPRGELDHNGAFQQHATVKGRLYGERYVAAQTPDLRPMNAAQIGAANMDGVMVFSGHGGTTGFAGLSTREAAQLVAGEIQQAQAAGRSIDKVVLDACHQRDARWMLGGSNAQAFESELNAALKNTGAPRVTVLAAEHGGPTYGFGQRGYVPTLRKEQGKWVFDAKLSNTNYTPAANGAQLYVDPATALAAGTLGAGGGYAIYRSVRDR